MLDQFCQLETERILLNVFKVAPRSVLDRASLRDACRSVTDRRLTEFVERFGVDEGARVYVEELRWPDGPRCLRCCSARVGWLEARGKHYCRDCAYQFRVTVGTVLHDSHVSLASWLVAIQLMVESERGFPAQRLWRVLGGSYKTAWFVNHRIRSAMSRTLLTHGMPVAVADEIDRVEGAPLPPALLGGQAARKWRLVSTLVAGPYHRPGPEYLAAYWNEACWRAANVDNADLFRETVCALLEAEPLPYQRLIHHTRPRTPTARPTDPRQDQNPPGS